MNESHIKSITKCVLCGIFWSIVFVSIGLVIVNFTSYILKDVLFIEGIVVVVCGALSSISGNSIGLSLQALAQNNAQYVANANLEATKMERQKNHNSFKTNLRSSLSTISLVIGGVICIIINFII